jgi:hypothetical protein
MAAVAGITIIKQMPYRGATDEEYSNTYHFSGSVPADNTAWTALFDALVAQEKTLYGVDVKVVRGYGYATDDPADNSVWSHDISASPVVGTLAAGTSLPAPGDAAVWVRWKTSRVTSPGAKPIYLRKYFHVARVPASGSVDSVHSGQKSALDAFGTKLWDGSFIDGRIIRSQSHAETILSSVGSTYVTTRTLKRRGKRPTS